MRLRFLVFALTVLGCFFFFDVGLVAFLRAFEYRAEASTPKTAAEWLRDLQDPTDPTRRTRATDALWKFGMSVVPEIAVCLHHDTPQVGNSACLALTRLGPAARAAVPDLIELVQDPEEPLRIPALRALAHIGLAASSAVDVLSVAARDEDPEIRNAAIDALVQTGPSAVPSLLELLNGDEPQIQRSVMHALTRSELRSEQLCRTLSSLAANGDRNVHRPAFAALAVQGQMAIHRLEALLENNYTPIRIQAAMTLCMMGTEAQDAACSILDAAVLDKDANVRFWALRTLAMLRMEKEDRDRIAVTLDDPEADVRWQARYTLAQIRVGDRRR